jgi:cyanate lyase
MQDITEQLSLAKVLIRNMIASHQGTPESAVRYATRQLDLPPDVKHDLIQYAYKLNK